MSQRTDKLILELRRRASEALQGIEDAAAELVSEVVDQVIGTLAAYLETNPEAPAAELMDVLAALIQDGAQRGADLMVNMGSQVIDVALKTQMEVFTRLGVTTANELVTSVTLWSDAYKFDLLREGHQEWYGRLKNEVLHPGGSLRESLEAANVWGDSMTEAAKRLIAADPELSNFPPRDMDPLTRAKQIIRTESTRFDTAVSVSLSESIGIDRFISVGVGDTRQSDECWLASQAEPMTLEAWATYSASAVRETPWRKKVKTKLVSAENIGASPRHPNCRCALVGVGDEYNASESTLQEAGVIV